jgi:PAS domain S-box-containing protein/putative nucleotidyltransferase with HDIG domain
MTKKRPVQVKADVPSKNLPVPDKSGQAGRDLRRRAEEKAKANESKTMETLSPEAARQVLHDLRVHQIELEMQNEELRRAQEALDASQARYFDLYDLAPIGYCILDQKGLILEANLTAATLLGVDRGVLIKQPLTRFILPEDQDIYYRHRKQLFERGAPQICEFRMLRANAAPFWARVEATAARAADGASVCRVVMSDITERKRAEILLQESYAKYEAIFEATGTATLLVEEDAAIITANSECLSATGYSPEELLGTKWTNYVAPESLEIMLKYHHLRREEPGKVPHKYEVRLVNKKGEIRNVVLDIAMIPGTKRSVVSMLDITERKKAEEALRESEEKYRTVVENALEVILVAQDGMVKFVNHLARNPFSKMTGYSMQELFSSPFLDFIHPEDRDMVGERYLRRLRGDVAQSGYTFRLVARDGSIKWVQADAVLVDWEGKPALLNFLSDITERKRAEEALRESEERFRSLYENATIGLYRTAPDGRIFLANRALVKMLGHSSFEDLSTINLETSGFAPSYSRRQFIKSIENEGEVRGLESAWTRKDGSIIHVRESARAVRDGEGNILHYDGTVEDITERKRAEESLKENEAKLQAIFNTVGTGIIIIDRDTLIIIEANQAAMEMTGLPKKRIIGQICHSLVCPAQAGKCPVKDLGQSVDSSERKLIHADGHLKDILKSVYPITIKGKDCYVESFIDITERKRAGEALLQAEENFRRSLDESPLGIRVVSVEGETLYANRAILDIYGYDDIEELRSTPVKKRYTPASYAEYQIRKKMRMKGEDCPSEYEISIIRKTGERRRLQVLRKEVLWNGRKQFQSIYRDITETKKLEEKLRESLSGMEKAFSGIIQVLSTISEKRDPYTAGHQTRVADLTRAIAQDMGLPPERVEAVRLAGTIHDIGKVSVPAEILSKPARLTKVEFDMVKSHAQVGYDILRDVDFAWPLAGMVLQHHERMDGSGYPKGLKGEAILLEARILAVADVVEAMASHRPYRPALGIKAALEEIEKNSGILYDSAVVSTCLGLFREKGFNFK